MTSDVQFRKGALIPLFGVGLGWAEFQTRTGLHYAIMGLLPVLGLPSTERMPYYVTA